MIITLIVFLLILSVLVLIHEAGHYFVAKKFGIKVEEFGFGFPLTPPLWQKKKGETIYSFYPVLIGGFVKLYGEDDAGGGRVTPTKNQELSTKNSKDEHRAFFSRSIGQRAAVIVAGVFMNVILAIAIYYVFIGLSGYKTVIPLVGNTAPKFVLADQKFVPKGISIGAVAPNSPAEKAGIKAPAVLLTLDGKTVKNNNELIALISSHKGREVEMSWYEILTETKHTAKVTPRVSPPPHEGSLGISFDFNPYNIVLLSYDTPQQKIFSGIAHTYNMQIYNIDGLKTLFDQSVSARNIEPISKNVGGPVGIFSIVGKIVDIPDAKERILGLLNLAGLLSLSLAFFNVLPIPGLDGGRLLFIVIEGVIGRKVNPKVEGYFHSVGMVLLIALLLLVTIKDVVQLFK